MFSFLSQLFSTGDDIRPLISQNPTIIDVRSQEEYAQGHVDGSVNIPLPHLMDRLSELPSKDAILIVCCASGSRSGAAKNMLQSKGYTKIYNGGSWQSVDTLCRRANK